MTWKHFIPFYGKKKVKKKIREIKHVGISFPVVIGTSFTKLIESVVVGSQYFWNWMLVLTVTCVGYVYWDTLEKLESKAEDKLSS